MAYTKASGQAVNRYSKKAYDDVRVRVKKGQKELIQKRAEELKKSVNSYIDVYKRQGHCGYLLSSRLSLGQ